MTIKKRIMVVLALAMMVSVLATGVAQAATQRPLTLTKSASADSVRVGDSVAFTITETNNQPFALEHVGVRDELPAGVEFVSASSTQGSCSFDPATNNVQCDLGTLPSGATAYIDVVVTPKEPGTITNNAYDIGENQASASVAVYPSWIPQAVGKAIAVAGGAVAIAG